MSETDLDLAERHRGRHGGTLKDALAELGVLTDEVLVAVQAEVSDTVLVDLRERTPARPVLDLVDADLADRLGAVPLEIEGGVLTAAFANCTDLFAIDELERATNHQVRAVAAFSAQVRGAIRRLYQERKDLVHLLDQALHGRQADSDSEGASPIIELVEQILIDSIEKRASDIHFHPESQTLRVRLRIDGVLCELIQMPSSLQASVVARVKVMAGLDVTERRVPQDGRIRFEASEREVDLRVSTLPTSHGESVVLRVLDSGSAKVSIDEVGLSDRDFRTFDAAIANSHGMILVTGPTGSGKTTTLYAALDAIDHASRSVFTLEDPIEYDVEAIRQCQINTDIGMDFPAGLRSLLRQDPDVLLVGEIRDQTTAELAVRTALTGHLVFSTLHTNSASGAIARLQDMGVDRYLLPSALVCIVGQRLVRRLCGRCKTRACGPDPLLGDDHLSGDHHWRSGTCERCGDTGYRGRLPIFEVLHICDEMHDALLAGVPESDLEAQALRLGMTTMRTDGLQKAADGLTDVAEVLRVLG
ncbi:MAG: GspE/PulE family protein [Pseudomonadota bacterium]